jgi:AAA family ATP:ADP antiporter
MRVTDSTLRYSLHRAISNLLYVPLTPGVRAKAKAFIDVSTQRVGQVVGSVAILAIWRLGGGHRALAAATLVLGLTSVVMALRLTQPYLDVFRTTLKQAGTATRLTYPNLDVESLSSLMAAFNSEDERVVVAAMDLVAEQGEVQVIPAVMLFHPSRTVVLRNLEFFDRHQRAGSAWALERLRQQAEDPQIRAAALSAHARQHNDDAALRAGLDDADETVRMTALVGLVSGGWMNADAAARALSDAVANASPGGRASLAAAIRSRPSSLFERSLVQMADTPDVQVRTRVAEAMAQMPSERFLQSLLSMLSVSGLREPARQALISVEGPALDFLDACLHDERLPRTIRIQIPGSISRFDAPRAIPVLWRRLLAETDELIQFKILRGINRLVADAPQARPNAAAIASAIRHVSLVGLRYARWRTGLEHDASAPRRSDAGRVLIQLLADKQARATESIFRLLALDHPAEDFARIYRGLHGNRLERASSHELLESVVHPSARDVILALLDDSDAHARQARLDGSEVPAGLTYDETLAVIVHASTGLLHTVAAQHAAEAGPVSAP